MNILFVTWDGPQVSYLEGLFLPIFRRMQALGYRFHVLQFTWGDAGRREECARQCEQSGIPYRAVEVWRRPVGLGSALTAMLGGRDIEKAVRDWNIKLLFPRSTLPGWAALAALRRVRLPLVFDADGLPLDERVDFAGQSPSSWSHRLQRDIEAEVVRRAHTVLTRSAKACGVLLSRAGASTKADKFHVVGNGRCPEAFTPTDASKRFSQRAALGIDAHAPLLVYSGSLGAQYCFPEMMKLLGSIHARCPPVRMLVLTGSPDVAAQELKRHPELAALVVVRSALPADVPGYLACADLGLAFRQPSFSMQGVSPIKIGEYLLCGLPVIATRGVGDVDTLDSPAVFLTNGASDAEVEQATTWFLDEVLPHRERLRQDSRRTGQDKYSIELSVQSYARAFNALRS